MLGDTVRQARIRKNLTQARLAKLAGVSRRHLAALEKGANVSINILQRVASVLDLTEIQLGDLSLRPGDPDRNVNVPLLTDTIREARAEAERAQAILTRAEGLLGVTDIPKNLTGSMTAEFPRMPLRHLPPPPGGASADMLRERPEWIDVTTAGEIRHGDPIDESKKETVLLPQSLIEPGEVVFRARGENMREQGIEDNDLLVVELRARGRAATGELVIARIGRNVYVGRWWQKHGRKALVSNGLAEVTVGRSERALRIIAAINQILRT
ncbi:MAG TPA: helix-turn-helix domain-containing protein [Thermoanaerobaculia bacterium]|jgi:transcriptional regulator with XRE-family HTH domain